MKKVLRKFQYAAVLALAFGFYSLNIKAEDYELDDFEVETDKNDESGDFEYETNELNDFEIEALDNIKAAGYPLLIVKDYKKTANIGETLEIKYEIWPEFKNEKIETNVYNSDGVKVATSSHSFYNTSKYPFDYSVTWDTTGYASGDYKVVSKMSFYSLYRWNEAPNEIIAYITLNNGFTPNTTTETSTNEQTEKNNVSSDFSITTSGIYCASTSPSIVAGMVTEKSNLSDDIEYRWIACEEKNPDNWFEVSPWTKNNEWLNWTPEESGNYVIVGQARVVGNADSQVEASFGTPYYKHIKGICQMPYEGEGGGYLIGFESLENPGQSYKYEMLILDCTLLAEGKDAWTYTTGKCGVAEGNALWTVWQPQYGYYWTLFRLYDASGSMIDEVCYGFANIY